jgi:hypothetical protein
MSQPSAVINYTQGSFGNWNYMKKLLGVLTNMLQALFRHFYFKESTRTELPEKTEEKKLFVLRHKI